MTITMTHTPDAAGRCGACGYSTAGLTTLVCPECGGDFRRVGIVTRVAPHVGRGVLVRFAVAVAAFTGLFMAVALPAASALLDLLPQRRTSTAVVRLSGPRSGAYGSITVAAGGSVIGAVDRAPSPALTVHLYPTNAIPSPVPPLVMPPAGDTDDSLPRVRSQQVLTWMAAAGIDATQPAVQAEARRVAAAVRTATSAARSIRSGSFRSSSTGGGGPSEPFKTVAESAEGSRHVPVWILCPLIALGAALWALAMRLLSRAYLVARRRPAT